MHINMLELKVGTGTFLINKLDPNVAYQILLVPYLGTNCTILHSSLLRIITSLACLGFWTFLRLVVVSVKARFCFSHYFVTIWLRCLLPLSLHVLVGRYDNIWRCFVFESLKYKITQFFFHICEQCFGSGFVFYGSGFGVFFSIRIRFQIQVTDRLTGRERQRKKPASKITFLGR